MGCLEKLDLRAVYEALGSSAVLLCWCARSVFCHRRLVSFWIEKALKIKVEVFDPRKKTPVAQGNLDMWYSEIEV